MALCRVLEGQLRLAYVVEDRKLRADGVSGVKLLERPLVGADFRELEPARVVGARHSARVVRRRRLHPTQQEQNEQSDLPPHHGGSIDNIG